jgi:hypothetical protein
MEQHHQGGTPRSRVEEGNPDKKMEERKKKKKEPYGTGEPMEWALKGIPDSNAPIHGTESTEMAGRDSEPSQENP